jgi:hypothetical protein
MMPIMACQNLGRSSVPAVRRRLAFIVLLAAAVVAWPSAADARVGASPFPPRPFADAADAPESPLDLRAVTFAQHDTWLWLRIRTAGAWSAGQLGEDSLCVALARGRMLGRLCVASDGRGAPVIRYARAGGEPRTVPAVLLRDGSRSLFARIRPASLGIRFGALRWHATSRWVDREQCVGGCEDRAPARGSRRARIGALVQPRCFGAAARTPGRRCLSRRLRRMVFPSPSRAIVTPDLPCRLIERRAWAVVQPCEFGDRSGPAEPARVALIGDSHAEHFRATVDVVAAARGWRAVSMTFPGCAFSTEVYDAPGHVDGPKTGRCRRHTREAISWLRAHPDVHTLFTSASAGRGFGAGGFAAAFAQVPATVKRIVVLRDIPRVRLSTDECVLRVMRRRARAARACAVPRAAAILGDPAAAAARSMGGRARVVDLTRLFCDRARCFPVIGGAYVYRDDNHLNPVFATTLGPFVLRRSL